jgi:hypothetical protein
LKLPTLTGGGVRIVFSSMTTAGRSLPIRWMSAAPEDPFVVLAAGRSPLRVAELRELADLVRRLRV